MCHDAFAGSLWEKCPFSSCSRIGQALDIRQTNKSEDLLSPSLSNRKARLCVYVKVEEGKRFIHNHCCVWEPLLLSRKTHKSSLHLLIINNFQWPLEVCSLGRKHQNPSLPWVQTHLPIFTPVTYLRASEQASSPKVLPRSNFCSVLPKEDLCIIFLTDLQIAWAAWWTRVFLGHGSIEILPHWVVS